MAELEIQKLLAPIALPNKTVSSWFLTSPIVTLSWLFSRLQPKTVLHCPISSASCSPAIVSAPISHFKRRKTIYESYMCWKIHYHRPQQWSYCLQAYRWCTSRSAGSMGFWLELVCVQKQLQPLNIKVGGNFVFKICFCFIKEFFSFDCTKFLEFLIQLVLEKLFLRFAPS